MEISFTVKGSPPAKDSGLSIFNKKHPQRPCVVNLLEKAKEALECSTWNPSGDSLYGLELIIIERSAKESRGDAINYLGGVADVLQRYRANADLSHLDDDLAQVALYPNDKLIRDARVLFEAGIALEYRVRVWEL